MIKLNKLNVWKCQVFNKITNTINLKKKFKKKIIFLKEYKRLKKSLLFKIIKNVSSSALFKKNLNKIFSRYIRVQINKYKNAKNFKHYLKKYKYKSKLHKKYLKLYSKINNSLKFKNLKIKKINYYGNLIRCYLDWFTYLNIIDKNWKLINDLNYQDQYCELRFQNSKFKVEIINFFFKKKIDNLQEFKKITKKILFKIKNQIKRKILKIVYNSEHKKNIYKYIVWNNFIFYKASTVCFEIKKKTIANKKMLLGVQGPKLQKQLTYFKNVNVKSLVYYKNKQKFWKTIIYYDKDLEKYKHFKYCTMASWFKLNINKKKFIMRKSKAKVWLSFKLIRVFVKTSNCLVNRLQLFLAKQQLEFFKLSEKHINLQNKYFNSITKKSNLIRKAISGIAQKKTRHNFRSIRIKNIRYTNKTFWQYSKLIFLKKKKTLKFINFNKTMNVVDFCVGKNIIFNNIYINKHTVSHYFVKFFTYYKVIKKQRTKLLVSGENLKKEKKKSQNILKKSSNGKVFLFNSWRGLLVTWKEARNIHWKQYGKGTLKKNRYRNFLPQFLNDKKVKFKKIINFFLFKFNFSKIFWETFETVYMYFFEKKLKIKQIFQLPINLLFWIFINNTKKITNKIGIKIKFWLYKKINIKKNFWMQMKKKTPKFFSKQKLSIKNIKNIIQYDFITNYFFIVKKITSFFGLDTFIFKNKLLKMHNFRYKA